MNKINWILVLLALLPIAGCGTTKVAIVEQQALPTLEQPGAERKAASGKTLAKLTAKDIKFHEKWKDVYKPENSFGVKWYNGQPQVMCYNKASQKDLSAALLQEILDYLSVNRPQTAADLADANFAYKLFVKKTTDPATAAPAK